MKLKIGTALLYHSRGFLPWAIRKVTKSFWNHAAIISKKTKTGYIIHEAQAQGIIKSEYTFEDLQARLDNQTIIPLESSYRLINIWKNCELYLNLPYGVITLLQILWMTITKRIPKRSDGAKRLICSEFVSRVLYDSSNKRIDFQTEFLKKFDFITPSDISKSTQLELITSDKY